MRRQGHYVQVLPDGSCFLIVFTYEEFDDNHSDVDYRMDASLPFLYGALKP